MALSFGLFQGLLRRGGKLCQHYKLTLQPAFYLRQHFPDRSPADIAWIGAAQVALMYTVGIIGNKAAANGYVQSVYFVAAIFDLAHPPFQSPHDRRELFIRTGSVLRVHLDAVLAGAFNIWSLPRAISNISRPSGPPQSRRWLWFRDGTHLYCKFGCITLLPFD